MPRANDRARAAYRQQVEGYLGVLERPLGSRARANVALSALVGSGTVARALGTPALAEPLLRDVREALKAPEAS